MEVLLSSNLCIGCFIWNVDILINMKFIITYTKILIDIATKQILFGSLVNAKERTNRSAKNIVKHTQRLILTYIPKAKGKKNKACWKIVGNWTCLGWKEVIQKVTSVFLVVLVVELLSCVGVFATPWMAACQASLSFTISQSLLKLMSIKSVTPSKHLILCGCLLLLPSIFPSICVFSNELALHIRWPKYEFQLQHQSFQWIFRTDFL